MAKILCSICMREGSKGIRNKNLIKINSKYLFFHTINQAKKSKIFDKIVVSTDSKKIRELSNKFGAECWFYRPKKFSQNKSPKLPVIKHLLKESELYFNNKFDFIIDLDVTSPLRKIDDIKNAYIKFRKYNSNNLISVYEAGKNPYFNQIEFKKNKYDLVKKIKSNPIRRQDSPKVYNMNASIYIWKRDFLLKSKTIFHNKTSIYIMPKSRSIDIDNKFDLEIVKYLMKKKKI